MKKLSLSFLLLLLCLNLCSQGKFKTQAKFGLKLGTGVYMITNGLVKTHPRIGLMGGMWLQIKLSKTWTVQPELTYIQKGAGGSFTSHPNYGDYWLGITYFEFPLLFQYHKKNVYFEFGPGLATYIKAGETMAGGVLPYLSENYPFSKKDFTFNVGTGYVFNEKWAIGMRLSHSLLPVRKQLPETSHPGYNIGAVFSASRQINFKASRSKQSKGFE